VGNGVTLLPFELIFVLAQRRKGAEKEKTDVGCPRSEVGETEGIEGKVQSLSR
jgi:hypothetical protein